MVMEGNKILDTASEDHGAGSSDHIWSRSEIDKMITRTDPMT